MAEGLLACSWSGGKDSAYALYKALRPGGRPAALVTMLTEDGERSRSHGIHRSVLEAQARRVGAPLIVRSTTWPGYEDAFVDALRETVELGAGQCVFGDIDYDDNRAWEERVCAAAGMAAEIPLWHVERRGYIDELLSSGFRCKLVAVKDAVLSKVLLGRRLDQSLVHELRRLGVDLAGEAGEYHTLLVSSPLFASPLQVADGDPVLRDGVWFLDQRLVA